MEWIACYIRPSTCYLLGVKLSLKDAYLDYLNSMEVPIAAINMQGKFERVNAAWTTVFGWTSEEMQGNPFLVYLHPDDVDDSAKAWSGAAEKGEHPDERQGYTNRYRCKDGSYVTVSWYGLTWDDGMSTAMAVPNRE